jgi:DNA-binding response OmpR family regulator
MSEQISILVVEDEAHIRRVLEYNLKLDGFEVYLAEDGAAGLKIAIEKRPDVILLDWLMPVMNGLQVLTKLKANSSIKHIPVLMLTALEIGADGYITKPFNPTQLGKTIREQFEKCVKKNT